MEKFKLKLPTIRAGSITTIFRETGSRLVSRLPRVLAATKEKLQATVSTVKRFFVLPPQPVEGTIVVVSELSARFLGTALLAVAIGLPPQAALLVAVVGTLLSARHVMAGYIATRVLRETGELLGDFIGP